MKISSVASSEYSLSKGLPIYVVNSSGIRLIMSICGCVCYSRSVGAEKGNPLIWFSFPLPISCCMYNFNNNRARPLFKRTALRAQFREKSEGTSTQTWSGPTLLVLMDAKNQAVFVQAWL